MPIQVAVVGCGSFARAVHLPNLCESSRYDLRMVVDTDADCARRAAGEFGATSFSTDYSIALSDQQVELVVICTPHDQHASMSLAAAEAGKHVLLEKPMALHIEEVSPIMEAVRRTDAVFAVGFNRRCSPLVRKAVDLLEGREYPLMINYRMVDSIWRHPWALVPEIGGGRILSEAVHLFDLCAYLAGAEPVRVFAEGGALTHPDIEGTQDNAVMTVKYADGSIASITIGDLGSGEYPKERVEMFFGERTMLIDNYQHFRAYGFEGVHDEDLRAVDKGLPQELEALAEAIRGGGRAPATEVDGARATLCAVSAIEALRTGRAQDLDLSSIVAAF